MELWQIDVMVGVRLVDGVQLRVAIDDGRNWHRSGPPTGDVKTRSWLPPANVDRWSAISSANDAGIETVRPPVFGGPHTS